MRQRRLAVVALVAVLFAVNVVARLVVRLAFDDGTTAQNRSSSVMFAIIGVLLAAATYLRSRQVPPSTWLPEIGGAAFAGLLLTILVGPFISGDVPFDGGAGDFFSQVWIYSAVALVGMLLGYWIATALGVDHRSKVLKAVAEARATRPRRVVRR